MANFIAPKMEQFSDYDGCEFGYRRDHDGRGYGFDPGMPGEILSCGDVHGASSPELWNTLQCTPEALSDPYGSFCTIGMSFESPDAHGVTPTVSGLEHWTGTDSGFVWVWGNI